MGIPYDLNKPIKKISLEDKLKEISGIEVIEFDLKKEECKKVCFSIDSNDLKSCRPGKQFNPSGIAVHPFTREIYRSYFA